MNTFPLIQNACERSLFDDGVPTMPNVRDALLDRFKTLQFNKTIKIQVDFQIQEKDKLIVLAGLWTPLQPSKLVIKPEGQRSWKWFQLITTSDVDFRTDDIVKDLADGITYRIMESSDWLNEGFVEYHLVQNYTGRTTA